MHFYCNFYILVLAMYNVWCTSSLKTHIISNLLTLLKKTRDLYSRKLGKKLPSQYPFILLQEFNPAWTWTFWRLTIINKTHTSEVNKNRYFIAAINKFDCLYSSNSKVKLLMYNKIFSKNMTKENISLLESWHCNICTN